MPTLHQQIVAKFLAKLAKSKNIDPESIEQLRSLLTGNKKVKPDDIAKIFSLPIGGEIK